MEDCGCDKAKQTDSHVVAWRVWAEVDFEIKEYNSKDDCFEDIPDDGFQAMRLWYADGTGRYISGSDYYFMWEHPKGLVFGQSNDTDIAVRYPGAFIKRGRHVPDHVIAEINQWMLNAVKPSGD